MTDSPYVQDPANPTDAELAAAIDRGLEDGSLIDSAEWLAANATPPSYGYIALYQGRRTEIYAASLYAAKQAALAFFKPPKSKRHLVTVHLAEIDGQPVTQVITS